MASRAAKIKTPNHFPDTFLHQSFTANIRRVFLSKRQTARMNRTWQMKITLKTADWFTLFSSILSTNPAWAYAGTQKQVLKSRMTLW